MEHQDDQFTNMLRFSERRIDEIKALKTENAALKKENEELKFAHKNHISQIKALIKIKEKLRHRLMAEKAERWHIKASNLREALE